LSRYAQRVASSTSANSTPTDQSSLDAEAAPADLLPTKPWRTILSRHCSLQESSGEVEGFGHCKLKEVIVSYLKRSKAINCHPDQILVLPDSQMAIDLIARLLVDPGDVCAVENPGNSGVRETLLSLGAHLQPISVDSNGLVVEELSRASDACK